MKLQIQNINKMKRLVLFALILCGSRRFGYFVHGSLCKVEGFPGEMLDKMDEVFRYVLILCFGIFFIGL